MGGSTRTGSARSAWIVTTGLFDNNAALYILHRLARLDR
jgi:hypothetical protein